jgi:hypothetical protein
MGQTISKHQQAWRFKLHVCKSGKEDGLYHLTTIEIAKAQKKDHQIYSKKDAKTLKLDWHFQLIENTIVLNKDENQSSQHLYK